MEPERKDDSGGPAVDELLIDLESDVEEVRRNAVQWLAKSGDRRAIGPLGKLTNDPSVSIRFFARKAIAAIEKRAAPDAARAPVRLPVGAAAAVGSEAAPHEPRGEELLEWKRRLAEPDPAARLRAVLDTYNTGLAELLPVLVEMLEAETESMVRSALVSAVGRYRDPSTLPLLYRSLDDPDSRVRANTVDALARFSDPGVVLQLARLAEDPDNRVQANLARAMGQFDPDFLHDQVTSMLGSGAPGPRESALYVLWAVRDEWCKAELDLLVSNASEDPEFRERARQFPAGLARLSRPMKLPSADAPPPEPAPAYEQGFKLPDALSAVQKPAEDPDDLTATMPGMDALTTAPLDVETLLARLSDRSADVKLSALGRVAGATDERIWEQVEILSVERNDQVRTAARRLVEQRLGAGALTDLSSAALAPRQTIDLSTSAMVLSKGAGANRTAPDTALDLTALEEEATGKSRVLRRHARPTTKIMDSGAAPASGGFQMPVWAKLGIPAVALAAALTGLVKLSAGGGASTQASGPSIDADSSASTKISQVASAKDLTRYIGVALPFSGKVLEARDREGRYTVQSAHGNVAVQFVRPVSKPPAVGDAVDVDGVLLGKTREGFLLLRGRKIGPSP